MGPDAMIFIFWKLSFKPTFTLLFHFYQVITFITFITFHFYQLFSSSSLSAIKVVSFAYLRLLIFLPAILIPAYASPSLTFHMMYSAYKLNNQGDKIKPWCTPVPIWNQSVVSCPVLTVASWLAYRFLRRQVRVWYFHLLKNFPQFVVIHTVKGFGIVNKAEIDVFLELLLFLWSSRCWQFDLWFLCLF